MTCDPHPWLIKVYHRPARRLFRKTFIYRCIYCDVKIPA